MKILAIIAVCFLSDKKEILIRLKCARKQNRFSQETLASKLQIRPETIVRWERWGTGLPNDLLLFKRFCQETKVSADWILGLEIHEKKI